MRLSGQLRQTVVIPSKVLGKDNGADPRTAPAEGLMSPRQTPGPRQTISRDVCKLNTVINSLCLTSD